MYDFPCSQSIMWPALLVCQLVLILQSEAQSPCLTHPTFRDPGQSKHACILLLFSSSSLCILNSLFTISPFSSFGTTKELETTQQFEECVFLNMQYYFMMHPSFSCGLCGFKCHCSIKTLIDFHTNIMRGYCDNCFTFLFYRQL